VAGYVIIIREQTTDKAGYAAALAKYTEHAMQAPNLDRIQPLATRGTRFEVMEGYGAENVALLKFPSYDEALAWYRSDAYQAAVPHRQSVARFRAFVLEGAD